MVLNEPETSLYPDLLPAIARLIASAAGGTQVVVVTRAKPLISALAVRDVESLIVGVSDLGVVRRPGGIGEHVPYAGSGE